MSIFSDCDWIGQMQELICCWRHPRNKWLLVAIDGLCIAPLLRLSQMEHVRPIWLDYNMSPSDTLLQGDRGIAFSDGCCRFYLPCLANRKGYTDAADRRFCVAYLLCPLSLAFTPLIHCLPVSTASLINLPVSLLCTLRVALASIRDII